MRISTQSWGPGSSTNQGSGVRFGARVVGILLLVCAALACGGSTPGTIGAGLGQKSDHRLFVRSLPSGEGGDRAGLMLDDEILAIDGKDVRTMGQDDVRRAVRGDVGSSLTVTILRNGEKRDLKVVRTPLTGPR